MKRSFVALSFVLAVVAASVACTPRDDAKYSCLDSGRIVTDVPADHGVPWPATIVVLPDGSSIDARTERFDNSVLNASGYGTGVKVHRQDGTRNGLCVVGGRITTTFDPETTAWADWHRIVGMIVETDDHTVIGTSFSNEGDMIAFTGGAQNWKVIGVRAEGAAGQAGAYIHDDCIENDGMASGVVDDVKLDGCNVFLSSSSGTDGTGHQVQVRNSLVRLQPYQNSYNTLKYGENKHGGFFKWTNPDQSTGVPPQLVITDSTFRADQKGSYGGNSNGFLGLPPGTRCDNVMLIGTEVWKASDLASWQDQCTNLTLGTMADWNARVATWDASHPAL